MSMKALFPAAAALALAAGPVSAQPAADPASSWAAMQKCAALANDEARHACADEVMRQAGVLASPQARAVERRKVFGDETPKPRPAPEVRQQARRDGATAAGGRIEKAVAGVVSDADADADKISVTLQDVSMRGDGKLLLVTSEGVTWRPIDSDPIRPMPRSGEAMSIERTLFGGYMCKLGKWTAFRCTRAPDPLP